MKGYLAYIMILDEGAHPEHPIVIPPPGSGERPDRPSIWPGGRPAHPIVIPPEGEVPERPPGYPAHPIYWPPHAEHPIVLPEPPPGVGGSPDEPPTGDWVFSPIYGWVWQPGEGTARPK